MQRKCWTQNHGAVRWDIAPFKPIRVLCVEDNELVADAIGRKLTGDERFQWLGWVNNDQTLLKSVVEMKPDVVCMDLVIAGNPTDRLIQRLEKERPDTRVLVLSGSTRESDVTRVMNAGAWGFVSKAEDSRFIVDAIQRVGRGQQVFGKITLESCAQRPIRPGRLAP